MIAQSLIIKIAQLFIFMLFGYILARTKVLKDESSSALSKISLYLMMPAAMLNAFDVELNSELAKGLLISFAAAILIHIVFFVIDKAYTGIVRAGNVERASIIYTNAGNIIIPIVISTLGPEWVVYTCGFLTVQQICIWSMGIRLFDSERKFSIKKILLNVNIIAIMAGFVMLVSGIRLPSFIKEITTPLANMIGPVGMIIAGILMPEVNFKKAFSELRIYRTVIMRMVVSSLIVTLLLKLGAAVIGTPLSHNVLMVSLFSSISPTAATMLQFSKIYDKEPEFAVSVNVATTLLCILTMPLMVMIYSL